MKKIILTSSLLILCLLAILIFSLKPDPHFSYIAFYIGKVEILKTDRTVEPAKIKYVLNVGDIVKTENNSKAYIQYGADALIEVNQNTEMKMGRLPGRLESSNDKTLVNLNTGRINVIVSKLKNNGEFVVRYLTQTISVRGTIFSVEGKGDKLIVIVKEGIVGIRDDNNIYNEFNVNKGQKTEISGKDVKISATAREDDEILTQVSSLMPITCMDCTPPEYVEKYYRWMLYKEKVNKDNKDNEENLNTFDKPSNNTSSVRLNINLLKSEGADLKTVSDITREIYNKLSAMKGEDRVIYRSLTKSDKKANRQLSGRISKVGSNYAVSLSVSDAETGNILFSDTKVARKDDINNVIYSLAELISNTAGIWNK